MFDRVRYMEWAKAHIDDPAVPFSLARSSVEHRAPADLGLDLDGLGFTTNTAFGLPELVEALGSRYAVSSERLLLTAGCTMANFLLCAALLRPGDRGPGGRPRHALTRRSSGRRESPPTLARRNGGSPQ